MQISRHGGYIVALLYLLFACSSMPADTINKKIAVFEVSYGEVLVTVNNLISNDDLTDAQVVKVKALVGDVATARQALYAALKIGDADTAREKLDAALSVLQLVQTYITD